MHARAFSELELLRFVSERAHGVVVADVVDAFGCSPETARRGLVRLAAADVGVRQDEGETPHRFAYVARGRLSPEQRWALLQTRELLVGLNGSRLVRALDAVVGDVGRVPVDLDGGVGIEDPAVSAVVYEALVRRRRLRVRYAGLKDEAPRERNVEVHHLKQVGGAWYATVSDLASAGRTKTFKVARITSPLLLPEPATHEVAVDDVYRHSVGVWDGPLWEVTIRLDGAAARQAHEYPLNITQRETPQNDGSVVVVAQVAGLEETARWVWRWGKDAQALSPPPLVERCKSELSAAAARYA